VGEVKGARIAQRIDAYQLVVDVIVINNELSSPVFMKKFDRGLI
jgi:hypothetical protein